MRAQPYLWAMIERVAPLAISFVVSVIVARMVVPAAYGLVAMLGMFMALGQAFTELGFGAALVQRKEITADDETTVFVINLVAGLLITVVLCAISPLVALFMHQEMLTRLLCAQSLGILIASTGLVQFAKLSGLVPVIGVVSGYCFAGNAAMLGCCDVIIATTNASIGMGGPAMIEGGGLGVYHPAEVGPVSFQAPNGVIDILVEDEAEATRAAQKYLSYFQGSLASWNARDQRLLRRAIPENRLRVYDVRNVIDLLADEGSVLEIRRDFGVGIITAFIRIEGKPFGLIANNPKHLGGAIDAPAGDKAARFMQLCDAFDIPIVSLCDTPGFMVGPEAEKTAIVRHVARMFVTGASRPLQLI